MVPSIYHIRFGVRPLWLSMALQRLRPSGRISRLSFHSSEATSESFLACVLCLVSHFIVRHWPRPQPIAKSCSTFRSFASAWMNALSLLHFSDSVAWFLAPQRQENNPEPKLCSKQGCSVIYFRVSHCFFCAISSNTLSIWWNGFLFLWLPLN